MRVLWLSPTSGLLNNGSPAGYGGGGWISSLEQLFIDDLQNDKLALCFLSSTIQDKIECDSVTYYPIYIKPLNGFKKIIRYYRGYKKYDRNKYVNSILSIIENFNPDIIHLFGMESPLSNILGKTNVPIVVHLQGLLGPCDNAFYPEGINSFSFLWPPTFREWVIRNGYHYAKRDLHNRAMQQSALFKEARYFMGRTTFDYQVSQLLSPSSKYYKVDEVLRPQFYQHVGTWKRKDTRLVITSTISDTVYKGLDVILKTARLLKDETNIDFLWNVVGVNIESRIVNFLERNCEICSDEVNIHYLGVLNADQLVQTCLDSTVYVHPSYIDNSPNSVCEAQLLGLPVISTNVGGCSSLVTHLKTGILVPANAPYEMVFWLKYLYENKTLVDSLSNNAAEEAKNRHNMKSVIQELKHCYELVLKEELAN